MNHPYPVPEFFNPTRADKPWHVDYEARARQAAHRMRVRFRQLFRMQVANTVTKEDLESELQEIRALLSG